MGGHHKKNLRAEKAKVKLKGAKLPKGLNVTKTDFKVRKIVIRDQLTGYVEGQRQVNLKETLTRLKHHSSSFRLEALRSIREAIAAKHPSINGHLNELIQGISAISLDVDKETRRESFKTMGSLLELLSIDTVSPFFHVVSSYLRCAMTHIQPTLQEDSLLMLDVLLQHVPHLVATHSDKIFQNFLEMISRVRAEGDRAGRTLTINMGQRQTTVKWRTKVLYRLQQMLETLAEQRRQSRGSTTADNRRAKVQTFNPKEPQHYSVKRTYANQEVCSIPVIQFRPPGTGETLTESPGLGSETSVDGPVDQSTILRLYVQHLMPLLLEAWMEVRPQGTTCSTMVALSADAAQTLKVVLEIIDTLWVLVELLEADLKNNDLSIMFQQEYADVFTTTFMQSSYPYQQIETADKNVPKKGKKSHGPDSGGPHCMKQNLMIAYLMCRYNKQRLSKQSASFSKLLQYLHGLVVNIGSTQAELQNYHHHLVYALRAFLFENGAELVQLHEAQLRHLLRVTVKAFLDNQFHAKEDAAGKMLVTLCDIVKSRELFAAIGPSEFYEFLIYLPQLLLKPSISESTLLAMSSLAKQRNESFLEALKAVVAPVIETIQKMQVLGSVNAFEGKKHIINLFYWTDRRWDDVTLGQLVQLVDNCITDKRIVAYFKFVLTHPSA